MPTFRIQLERPALVRTQFHINAPDEETASRLALDLDDQVYEDLRWETTTDDSECPDVIDICEDSDV